MRSDGVNGKSSSSSRNERDRRVGKGTEKIYVPGIKGVVMKIRGTITVK